LRTDHAGAICAYPDRHRRRFRLDKPLRFAKRGLKWTFEALTGIKNNASFPILEFHSGNGSECYVASFCLPIGMIITPPSGLEEEALQAAVYAPRFPLLNRHVWRLYACPKTQK
jgi:hypothetical protein